MKRKICVVTSSRADYGYLRGIAKTIHADKNLRLQMIATGTHCDPRFGLTYQEIIQDGLPILVKCPIHRVEKNAHSLMNVFTNACQSFAEAFHKHKPDIVVLLGDRYETLAAAIAGYFSKRIIAHIHGGETTEGAMDEGIRHAITKMAHIHFPAAEVYRKRIIQLGEHPKHVFNFGSPSMDIVYQTPLLDRNTLFRDLRLDTHERAVLMTYHPETLSYQDSLKNVETTLKALTGMPYKVILTKANADKDGTKINALLKRFSAAHAQQFQLYDSLGHTRFLSCLKYFDFMIGNSSSGIIEAPSFQIPVINIGCRQQGRVMAKNIISVEAKASEIQKAIKKAVSVGFRQSLKSMQNPYAKQKDGKIAQRIVEVLKSLELNELLLQKSFYNIK
ncbi:MAG: UDP-N-acetylglucosamine 2-epimerase (hydrolyzing) [Candidatus Omnitrophica bacterium]|nr:UDP-N-acetylglucosamine 2-epimerase (hydrolyzing) [Candidatus Omnitrophota bacterium]